MDRCPPEILVKIFRLACIDGGRTACALSLVSHQVRTTSSLVGFYTVALHGIHRMRSFLDTVRKQVSCPIVAYLFLYDGGLEGEPYFEENALDMVTSIVSVFSPSLRTLAGDLECIGATYFSLFPPGTDLSLLQELSLNVCLTHESDVILPNLPRLRRLHKWGRIHSFEGVFDAEAVIRVAPNLTHIRFSGLIQAHMVPAVLDAALKRDSRGHEEVPKLQLPNGLEKLLIQCASVDNWGWCGTSSLIHHNMQFKLSILATRHEEVVIVPECNYTVEDCMSDWLDMIEGGEGWRSITPRKTSPTLQYGQDPDSLESETIPCQSNGPNAVS